jgi:hypothetical protein
MNEQRTPSRQPLTRPFESQGDLTLTFRTGEVLRRLPGGQWVPRPPVPPLPNNRPGASSL